MRNPGLRHHLISPFGGKSSVGSEGRQANHDSLVVEQTRELAQSFDLAAVATQGHRVFDILAAGAAAAAVLAPRCCFVNRSRALSSSVLARELLHETLDRQLWRRALGLKSAAR